MTINNQRIFTFCFNCSVEMSLRGIILKKIRQIVSANQIVNGNDLEILS